MYEKGKYKLVWPQLRELTVHMRTGLVGFPAVWPILWRKSGSVEDELEVISKEQGKYSQEPGWQGY